MMTMGPTIRAMALLALFDPCAAGAAAKDATGPDLQPRGPYVGIAGGQNFQQVNGFRGGGADGNAGYGTGYVGLLNFGYALGGGLRFEIERRRRNEQWSHGSWR
jgi:OmpA-OmpF porin, OOP family